MTKFMHVRNHVGEGDVETKGGVTIAYTEEAVPEGIRVIFATAVCSSRDNYCRRTGRVIAEGRLQSDHYRDDLIVEPNGSVYEALLEVV